MASELGDRDYLDWKIVPLNGPNLAKEYTLSGLADGHFILESLLVHGDGKIEKAYIDVVLPEREIDSHFILMNTKITKGTGTLLSDSQVIPSVAIEKFGVYEQYYVKGHAEVGLEVLRRGLDVAKLKWPIALDLAYILRDEKRYAEAIDAFNLAIDQGTTIGYFAYAERADLFARLGNNEAANRDWEQVERIAGADVVKNLRGL